MNMVGVQGCAAYIHVFVYDMTCIETCILTHCLAYILNVMFCVVWGSLRLFMQLFVFINFAIFMTAMVMEKSPPPFMNPYDLSKRKDKDDWILHTLVIKGDSWFGMLKISSNPHYIDII